MGKHRKGNRSKKKKKLLLKHPIMNKCFEEISTQEAVVKLSFTNFKDVIENKMFKIIKSEKW